MMQEWLLPTIDLERCTMCGLCAERCPAEAVTMTDAGPLITRERACTYCGTCEVVCPADAIVLQYEIVLPRKTDPAGGRET
jgi:formate hydrogenlyase subunit 6/NADH:ubiquinone oxidoreductase subunit I